MTDNKIVYGHIKPESETRYRKYRDISRDFEDLGDKLGAKNMADANVCFAMALKYRDKANQSRVIISDGRGKDYHKRLTVEDMCTLEAGDRLQFWAPQCQDILHGTVVEVKSPYLFLRVTNENAGNVVEINLNLEELSLDNFATDYGFRHFNPAFDPEAKNV